MEIRNGVNTHFWFDDWLGLGRLIDVTGATGTVYLGLPRKASVIDAVNSNGWCVSGKRSRRHQDMYAKILTQPLPDVNKGDDIVLWKHGEDDFKGQFSSRATWDQLRPRKNKVQWSKQVWFSQGIPRYSFITWLTVLNRLSTEDRMRNWGVIQGCVLCGERDETRDHLFFDCPYSFTVKERFNAWVFW